MKEDCVIKGVLPVFYSKFLNLFVFIEALIIPKCIIERNINTLK